MLAVGSLGPQYSLLFALHELGREACLGRRHPPYPEGTTKDPYNELLSVKKPYELYG